MRSGKKGEFLKQKNAGIRVCCQFRMLAGIFFILIGMGVIPMITAHGQGTEAVGVSVSFREKQRAAVVTWEPLAGAVSYEILRSDTEDGEFVKVASGDALECEYTDREIQRGRYYYYRVAAYMEDGECHYSDIAVLGCPIRPVSHLKLTRSSRSSVEATWSKRKNAGCYKVYGAQKRKGKYRCIGITQDNRYLIKKLRPGRTYYYKVRACVKRKDSLLDSRDSGVVSFKTRPNQYTTVFAGDSIMTGMKSYHTLDKIKIEGRKELVAAIGLNTITFRTKRVFGGKSGLQKVISYKPYRVYMLLGINEIHYRSSKDVIAQYRSMVRTIQKESPETDIVLLPLAPVTEAEQQRRSGFGQIPKYNHDLQELADSMGLKYYDYTDFLTDSRGYLNQQYAVADGVHWNVAAYDIFARKLEEYDKTLE